MKPPAPVTSTGRPSSFGMAISVSGCAADPVHRARRFPPRSPARSARPARATRTRRRPRPVGAPASTRRSRARRWPPRMSPGATTPASAPATIRAASLSSPSTSTGRPAPRYSNSLPVATLRAGRTSLPSARTSSVSARALEGERRRAVEAADGPHEPAQAPSASMALLVGRDRPGEHDLEPRAPSGRRRRNSRSPSNSACGERPTTFRRPVCTRECRAGSSTGGRRRRLLRVEAVRDDPRPPAPAAARGPRRSVP